jgi:diaminopimelate epimerase
LEAAEKLTMKIPFAKYQAAGNDFIIVSAQDLEFGRRDGRARTRRLASLARAILARHTGVGADGLFVTSSPAGRTHALAVRIFNADGGEAEMSGNGIRCAAAWLVEQTRRSTVEIETLAGLKRVQLVGVQRGDRLFRVNMGSPILQPAKIPFAGKGAKAPVKSYPLPVSRGTEAVTVTSMGNPHCSLFVASLDNPDFDWRALGLEIERHPLFPNRTNVEFVRVLSRSEIEVRFWERGVGETASSGTGSSAAVVAAALNGLTGRRVTVKTRGGELEVNWTKSGKVHLTGPVRMVASGHYEYDEGGNAPPR